MKVQVGKHLFDTFLIQNVLKQGDALLSLFFKFALKCDVGKGLRNQEKSKFIGAHSFWSVVMIVIWLAKHTFYIKIHRSSSIKLSQVSK